MLESYDAMVFGRPYRQAMSRKQALHEIREFSGKQFEPFLVEKFLEVIAEDPPV